MTACTILAGLALAVILILAIGRGHSSADVQQVV